MLSCLISNLIILVFNYKTANYFIVIVYLLKVERGKKKKSLTMGYPPVRATSWFISSTHQSCVLLGFKLLFDVLFNFSLPIGFWSLLRAPGTTSLILQFSLVSTTKPSAAFPLPASTFSQPGPHQPGQHLQSCCEPHAVPGI